MTIVWRNSNSPSSRATSAGARRRRPASSQSICENNSCGESETAFSYAEQRRLAAQVSSDEQVSRERSAAFCSSLYVEDAWNWKLADTLLPVDDVKCVLRSS